jgi:4-hydroxy-2-oxoheptanedioate aldolase
MTNTFKATLLGPKQLRGIWMVSGSTTVTEALSVAGWDFLVLDLEHAAVSAWNVSDHLRAAQMGGTPVIVRLADANPGFVKQALDAGAQNLMFPFIENAEEARQAVALTRYAPEGSRGLARVMRASRYGTNSAYAKEANASISIIAQLESMQALGNLADVASVPGVDALFIGPGDISASLGLAGEVGHPEVIATLHKGFEACRKLGKSVGTILPNAQSVKSAFASGCTFAAVSSDIGTLIAASKQAQAALID